MRNLHHAYRLMVFMLFLACTPEKKADYEAELWLTTTDKRSLLEQTGVDTSQDSSPDVVITINPAKTYQTMDGFGYTLTGGSALHIHNMSAAARKELLRELFGTGKDGIGVSYLRVSIGASDLDERLWSYNDTAEGETDEELDNFSMAYDTLHLIPVLKEILQIAPEIKIMGSPWSPPKWMKDNNDTRGGSLLPGYYDSYARYFVKYIEGMREQGIPIDAITVQNEPLHPGNNPSLLMLPEQQGEFIKDHLGPAFESAGIDTKIIIYDHNADRPDYPISILDDPEAAKYVDGSAFHLYGGEISALSRVHKAHPDKNLYFTEQWVGAPGDFAKEMAWHTENLIIGATRNWCKTVLEWNLAADENQDPHTDRGGCDRCLGAVTITGDQVTREPAYYIIAQASRFVPPGSVRVDSDIQGDIANVAFKTPEGKYVCILQNTGKEEQKIAVKLENRSIPVKLGAGAIGTLMISLP
ncbi:glycoside hydrolase family 30 protein [Sinomicrobium sp. M5D2P9]